MNDIVDRKTRSRMMRGIRGKDTKPEMLVRRGLHARGFRYRLHAKGIPGKPDLWLPRYNAAVFVHGCFWHRHDCGYFKWPSTRPEFWKEKILGNLERDQRTLLALRTSDIRTAIVWECALRGATLSQLDVTLNKLALWLSSDAVALSLPE